MQRISEGSVTIEECNRLKELITSDVTGELALYANAVISGFPDVTDTIMVPSPFWQGIIKGILAVDKPPVAITKPVRKFYSKIHWGAAAAVLLTAMLGIYLLMPDKKSNNNDTTTTSSAQVTDILPPERNKATITLADGSVVYLDNNSGGQLAQQGSIKVIRMSDGQVTYQNPDGKTVKEIQYNTLTNPRGSKVIDIVMADGSRVWLNAGSKITYPVAFVGNERRVQVTGEAYFEIVHNKAKPFYVTKGKMQVEVLGTHFNVNAYDDEVNIKVTLLEGTVNVSGSGQLAKLKPGEQAQMNNNQSTGSIQVRKVDVEKVMAWKNGFFSFDAADFSTVMRELARWYDLEVSYEGAIPKGRFKGEISKDLNLTQVLNGLSAARIRFKTKNTKQITILQEH